MFEYQRLLRLTCILFTGALAALAIFVSRRSRTGASRNLCDAEEKRAPC